MIWMFFVGLFAAVYLVLGLIAWRRPLLARLAWREALRRPWQSALLVAGLTVGTSMILMSLIENDSMSTSLSRATYESWGRVDILVGANGQFFSPQVAQDLSGSAALRGKVRAVQAGVELVGVAADLDRRLDNPTVRLIGFDPTRQPPFGTFALTDGRRTAGQELGSNEVLLSQSLADSLQARPGDSLTIGAPGFGPAPFKVFGIATRDGPGDYGAQPAVFTTLQTMSSLTGNTDINVVRISALGDGRQELDNSLRLASAVTGVMRDIASGLDFQVRTAKADDVTEIEKLAASNEPVNLAMSAIIILAGIALVVNLVIALAEERRPHLAVLRAMGLSRAGLVLTGLLEGAAYALGAALIGALPGIATGWLLVSNSGHWVPEIHEKDATVVFVVSIQSIATAIAAGALVTLVTLLVANARATRLSIASAVRSLPDASTRKRSGNARRVVFGLIGAIGLFAAATGDGPERLVGGVTAIASAGLIADRLPGRLRASLFGLAAVAWLFTIYATMSFALLAENVWITILVLTAGVLGLSVVAAVNMHIAERVIPRALIAQLTRRLPRLVLATTAVGLVLSLLTFIGVFLATTRPDYRRDTGGYDVSIVSTTGSTVALPPSLSAEIDRSVTIATSTYFGPVRSSLSDRGPGPLERHQQLLLLYQLTDEQLQPGLPLASRDTRFSSDAAVWAALQANHSYVVSGTYPPYTTVDLIGSRGPVQLTVIATFKPGFLEGIMGPTATLDGLSSAAAGTTMLVRLKPGVDPVTFATDVRRFSFPSGVEAITTRDLLASGGAIIRNFAAELELILLAGLGVGVMSLGVLALRAVVERRRVIGLLRAVGYQPRPLLLAVMGESLLTAAAGIVVGTTVGLFVGSVIAAGYYPGGVIRVQT
ncbi:MAG TPA: ABC transporter permease, partial [Candidatus Dormibacteraeota bacterium]|nr:ABC transporter permease [Candidatus Dormibacteraeota bacterium]